MILGFSSIFPDTRPEAVNYRVDCLEQKALFPPLGTGEAESGSRHLHMYRKRKSSNINFATRMEW
ncbi:hypothetical protein ANCCAN_10124 [Ancylostoma caninum]|uniref:Uncharacterized protein n=1 Tax=Ancylostoma caninum TaxID=29170 RepID=A0A368GHS6_ANCCA|nr:hypothetical protein ANCCAN_10124 [Ancylostoma caninum]